MNDFSNEPENLQVLPPPGIERTVTWLIAGVGVLLLFLAVLAGISKMQDVTTRQIDPSGVQERTTRQTNSAEIGIAPGTPSENR